MLAQEDLIIIRDIPIWTLVPFGIALVAAGTWVVRWIMRTPDEGAQE